MKKLEKYDAGIYRNSSMNSVSNYKYFCPSLINEDWQWEDAILTNILSKADTSLAELKGYSELIPNIEIFIKMHIRVEANKSNKIEGTSTSIEEDLSDKEDILPEKRDDWQDIQNYVEAINFGINKIKELPLSNRLIRNIHEILLSIGRGENKTPGEFRTSQNWIGGSNPSNAMFVPPIHTDLGIYLSDLENFIHNDTITTPLLVKIAIIHYQFETIHPFSDGNGRLGRLIIPLYLLHNNKLTNSCFYISNYFEKNRTEYYDSLTRVRLNNDMIQWIKFFLKGIIETADNAKQKFQNVLDFMKDIEKNEELCTSTMRKVLNFMYQEPVFTRKDLIENLHISPNNVTKTISKLLELDLIKETTGFSRNQIFTFEKYVNLFRD